MGETPTISEKEFELIVNKTIEYVDGRIPIFIGLGGNNTNKIVQMDIFCENAKTG